jgi:hypothetical protein
MSKNGCRSFCRWPRQTALPLRLKRRQKNLRKAKFIYRASGGQTASIPRITRFSIPVHRLRHLQVENDIKQRSFELREREIDTQARERERALADARDHLLSLSKALSREQATNQAHERRIADLETEVAQYRKHIGALIAGAIAERRPASRRHDSRAAGPVTTAGATSRSKKPVKPKPSGRRKAAATTRPSRRQPIKAKRKTTGRKPR